MSVNRQAIGSAVFSTLKSDAAGAAARALLGSGAASVIHAEDVESKPPRPFAAMREGSMIGAGLDPRALTFTWFLYDDPAQKGYRLAQLLSAVEAAYGRYSIDPIDTAVGHVEVGDDTPLVPDRGLGLLMRSIRVIVYAI